MGDAKKREQSIALTRMIEASEAERVAMSMILGGLVRAKGPNQSRHRRCYEQFRLVDAAEAMADAEAIAEAECEVLIAKGRLQAQPKPVRLSQFSSDLVEYEVTQDVIEYFTKTCDEADIPGGWLVYSGNVKERMEDKSYRAPSDVDLPEASAAEQ